MCSGTRSSPVEVPTLAPTTWIGCAGGDPGRSHPGIGLGDFLIAATVAVEGLQLATFNIRHFPMFPDLHTPFDLPRPDAERQ